jgi:uncharacterized membrane protein YfhO
MKKFRVILPYLLAFFVPVILFFLACQLQSGGIWPFGKNTIVTNDAEAQYIPFFSYLKTVFFGDNDFLYSFNNTLGGDFFGFSAYYLFSPFNLVYLVVEAETTAFLIVTLLKIGTIGLTAFIFLTRHFKMKPSNKTVIFSASYALMLYNAAFSANTMFLDGVVFLPLILMGIDKLLETGKSRFFVFSLAAMLCVQYYMAYIVCIGAALYFAYALFLERRGEIKVYLLRIRKFFTASVLAASLAAVVILPTFVSLQSAQRYAAPTDEFVETMIHFSFTDAPLQFFGFMQGRANAVYGMPFIFCGLAVAVLTVLYFFSRRVGPREKILSAGFIAVFLLSFALQPLDYAWHAFSTPNGFSFRYAFILTLFLIMIAYGYFLAIENSEFRKAKFSTAFVGIANTASLFVAATFVIWSSVTDGAHEFKLHEEVNYNIQNIRPYLDLAREADPGMYRLEKDFQYTENDPLLFGYNGLTHYSSGVQAKTVAFLAKLKFSRVERLSLAVAYRKDHTIAIDSLTGIKYVLVTEVDKNNVDRESEFLENIYALPMGFMANKNLLSADIDGLNYFELQNEIFRSLSGIDTLIFTPTDVQIEKSNLKEQRFADGSAEYTTNFKDIPGSLSVSPPVDDDKLYYFDLEYNKSQISAMRLNDEAVNAVYEVATGNYLDPPLLLTDKYSLSGEPSRLEIEIPESLKLKSVPFWQESKAALGEHYAALADEPCDLEKITSSHLTCEVTAKEDGNLFFSIPNDEGWTVKVDGKKVETATAFDLFMTVPLTVGIHDVEMKYTPRGLRLGAFISIATATVCAVVSARKFGRKTDILIAACLLSQKSKRALRIQNQNRQRNNNLGGLKS